MKIKMITTAAGPQRGYDAGKVYEVPGDLSKKMADDFVAGGYAEILEQPKSTAKTNTKTTGDDDKAGKGKKSGSSKK